MKKYLIHIVLFLLLTASLCCHICEFRKIREFEQTFETQSQIETKRTALMVLYQEVLQNAVREITALKNAENEENIVFDWGNFE